MEGSVPKYIPCETAADGYFLDGVEVKTCTSIMDAEDEATYTCTTASDSRVSACAAGFYRIVGSSGESDTCQQCITHEGASETAEYICTSDTDSQVDECVTGYEFIVGVLRHLEHVVFFLITILMEQVLNYVHLLQMRILAPHIHVIMLLIVE